MKNYIMILILSFAFSTDQYPTQDQIDKMLNKAFEHIWLEAMRAKTTLNEVLPQERGEEELLGNLSSSAPNTYFVTHADLSEGLAAAENTSASIFVSTDNQSSWIENDYVMPLGSPGYENTWGATTVTSGGDFVDWYLSGSIDSEALGLSLGQVTVSQSPFNGANSWPPSNNLYALVTSDASGDAGSGQDITNIKGTYSADRLFASMELNGGCCNEGGFFGPWYLYAIAIVNPDALDNGVAYAYAYGDGGFGELYPGIYKIYGDFSDGIGAIGEYSVLSTNFDYSTSGNQLQASSLLSIITEDADWGVWPNSLDGVALVGVTVEAGLNGLSVEITPLDNSDIGVLVLSTQSQSGNSAPVLSDVIYDNGELSVVYTDADNNLATSHDVFVDDMAFTMIPDSHTYSEGVTFRASGVLGGNIATLMFSDGGSDVVLDIEIVSSCPLLGDTSGDGVINVLDIVSLVNVVLTAGYNECVDMNADGVVNVLDIVSLVGLVLGE